INGLDMLDKIIFTTSESMYNYLESLGSPDIRQLITNTSCILPPLYSQFKVFRETNRENCSKINLTTVWGGISDTDLILKIWNTINVLGDAQSNEIPKGICIVLTIIYDSGSKKPEIESADNI